ncbi:glycosyltransferase family 39 protein, partial [Patescibacteria group bacterium]|nr:glycosyltransferase family 39 protein [Patescibacteria group bacterium]
MFKGLIKNSTVLAIVMLVIMTVLAVLSMFNDSGIVDEIAHIPAGYSYLKYHDYRLNPEHPPLAKALAAAPLMFLKLNFPLELPAWKDEANGQWEVGWKFIYERGNDADQILLASRLPMLLLMIVLGIYLYLFTKRTFGTKAALIALFLYSFSPNIIAHSRFVTTDIAATLGIMMTLYYYVGFIKKPSWKKLLWVAIALAIAQLLKYSCFMLYPFMAMLAFFAIVFRPKDLPKGFFLEWLFKNKALKRIWVYFGSLMLISLISFVIIAIFYQLMMYKMPVELQHQAFDIFLSGEKAAPLNSLLHSLTNNPVTRSFSYYLLGLGMVILRVSGGNTTYFLGETSNQAWWYFYPVAILIKTPLPTLIITVLASVVGLGGLIKFSKEFFKKFSWHHLKDAWLMKARFIWKNWTTFTALLVIAFFLLTGIVSNLNIGLRHVMPFYPFWFLLLGGGLMIMLKKIQQIPKYIAMVAISLLML